MILLLSFSSVVLSLFSCESEYQHRMKQAKELIRQEVTVRKNMADNFSAQSVGELTELKREIDFHAHISGNQQVFLLELNGYKQELVKEMQLSDRLISKYP